MTKKLAAFALLAVLSACRSAFMEEPVTRLSAPPAAQLAATVSAATELRRAPSADAASSGPVEAGAQVQVSQEVVHGFRRVKLADGKTGYVDAKALSVQGAPAGASK
ncbi:MAG: SH3 domain-containing protein [Anaeromyxobacteraceae bacterium]